MHGYGSRNFDRITVKIDIKPLDTTNPINIKKDTNVPVGLFGSSTFNVSNVDLKSIKFGGHTIQAPTKSSITKINKDTFKDIISQFKVPGLGFSTSDTQGCLTGKTLDGIPFRGCDSVKIINK